MGRRFIDLENTQDFKMLYNSGAKRGPTEIQSFNFRHEE